jgi:hypothetical protein
MFPFSRAKNMYRRGTEAKTGASVPHGNTFFLTHNISSVFNQIVTKKIIFYDKIINTGDTQSKIYKSGNIFM